jgi:hypothetical protein
MMTEGLSVPAMLQVEASYDVWNGEIGMWQTGQKRAF